MKNVVSEENIFGFKILDGFPNVDVNKQFFFFFLNVVYYRGRTSVKWILSHYIHRHIIETKMSSGDVWASSHTQPNMFISVT